MARRLAGRDARKREHARKQGLSRADFDSMLLAQDGCCAICPRQLQWRDGGIGQPLRIDHDHSCCDGGSGGGARLCGLCTRQFLCQRCNTMLGRYHDDPIMMKMAIGKSAGYSDELLESGIAYLKRWNAIMIERGVRKRDLAAETAQWMAEQMEEFLAIVSS